jgi:hypothetical protein
VNRLTAGAVALAGAAAAPLGATDIDPYYLAAIPPEYHGLWNMDAKACAPFTGRQRLEIRAREIIAGGDRFSAEAISWNEEGGVSAVSKYVGPGPGWERIDYFRLTDGGRTLIAEHARKKLLLRRCGR